MVSASKGSNHTWTDKDDAKFGSKITLRYASNIRRAHESDTVMKQKTSGCLDSVLPCDLKTFPCFGANLTPSSPCSLFVLSVLSLSPSNHTSAIINEGFVQILCKEIVLLTTFHGDKSKQSKSTKTFKTKHLYPTTDNNILPYGRLGCFLNYRFCIRNEEMDIAKACRSTTSQIGTQTTFLRVHVVTRHDDELVRISLPKIRLSKVIQWKVKLMSEECHTKQLHRARISMWAAGSTQPQKHSDTSILLNFTKLHWREKTISGKTLTFDTLVTKNSQKFSLHICTTTTEVYTV